MLCRTVHMLWAAGWPTAQTQQPAESAADINRVSEDGARLVRNSSIEWGWARGRWWSAGRYRGLKTGVLDCGWLSAVRAHKRSHMSSTGAHTHTDRWAGKIGEAATLITSRDCTWRREMIFLCSCLHERLNVLEINGREMIRNKSIYAVYFAIGIFFLLLISVFCILNHHVITIPTVRAVVLAVCAAFRFHIIKSPSLIYFACSEFSFCPNMGYRPFLRCFCGGL